MDNAIYCDGRTPHLHVSLNTGNIQNVSDSWGISCCSGRGWDHQWMSAWRSSRITSQVILGIFGDLEVLGMQAYQVTLLQ